MLKLVTSALFATVAGALTFGAAATLGIDSQQLGSGDTIVTSCDDEVDVSYELLAGEPLLVGAVVVSDIDPDCDGATLTAVISGPIPMPSTVIADGSGVLNADPVQTFVITPTAGYTGVFGLTDSVRAQDVEEIGITIQGP